MSQDPIKIDIAYKRFSKREYTSTQKRWHEEHAGKSITIKSKDIWSQEIPVIPPPESTNVVQVIRGLQLTLDVTIENQQTWLTCETPGDLTTRIRDFIQPDSELLKGYFVKVYDANDKRIYVGDVSNWNFDYANGVLFFETNPVDFTAPFKIDAYRYIGEKGVGGASSLQDAYNGPDGEGSGRVIHANFGPVEFDSSNGHAPLQINPINYTPTIGAAGQVFLRNGLFFVYDDQRSKWLSMNRSTVVFGTRIADGRFLNLNNFSSNMAGWPALRAGTILGLTAQASSGNVSKSFSILKNHNMTSLIDFNLHNLYYANGNLDLDFEENDLIKILASSASGAAYNIIINLEIAWRII